jgi:hypothetical protein
MSTLSHRGVTNLHPAALRRRPFDMDQVRHSDACQPTPQLRHNKQFRTDLHAVSAPPLTPFIRVCAALHWPGANLDAWWAQPVGIGPHRGPHQSRIMDLGGITTLRAGRSAAARRARTRRPLSLSRSSVGLCHRGEPRMGHGGHAKSSKQPTPGRRRQRGLRNGVSQRGTLVPANRQR